jgi:excisionase family DNA binding protein
LPRMRTISEAAKHVRASDPETAFTETALRRLIVTGTVPSVRVGVKYLIDLDALEAFLAGDQRRGTA